MATGSTESKAQDRVHITVTHVIELSPAALDVLEDAVRILADCLQAIANRGAERAVAATRISPAPAPAPPSAEPIVAVAASPASPASPAVLPLACRQPIAEAVASPAPPVAPLKLYTPAREAIVRHRYPAGMHLRDIRELLNELPGKRFETDAQVSGYATVQLKLRRLVGQGQAKAAGADDGPVGVIRSTAKPAPLPPGGTRLTAARIELLTREYQAGTPINDIDKLLRELPGEPIPILQIAPCAARLGLSRPATSKFATDHRETPARQDAVSGETVDWNTAQQWAERNGVQIREGTTKHAARILINDARQTMGLPAWNIISPRTPFEKLPDANLGASYVA